MVSPTDEKLFGKSFNKNNSCARPKEKIFISRYKQLAMERKTKLVLFLVLVPSILRCGARDQYRNKPGALLQSLNAFKSCEGQLCASRVSFCIIMKNCGCLVQPGEYCECCKGCIKCLGDLWSQCCNCVGLCHVVRNSNTNPNKKSSRYGELEESLPQLFEALSYGSNIPVVFMTRPRKLLPSSPEGIPGGASNASVQVKSGPNHQDVCKVAFFDSCLSRESCVSSCASMGSHRYRWFHNGCCQCVGQQCEDYGELQPLCKDCSS